MDDTRATPDEDQPTRGTTISRRRFFGRALAVAGAGAALLTLTGCPGGDQDHLPSRELGSHCGSDAPGAAGAGGACNVGGNMRI